MKNSTSETSIIKDIAIFDYVAGRQSNGMRENFEKLIEEDPKLMQEVATEKALRKALQGSMDQIDSRPVSIKNFDALLERIERGDSTLEQSDDADQAAINEKSDDNVVVVSAWRSSKSFSIAASFVFMAMIGVIGFNQITQPDFVTLSDQAASSEIDFVRMVEQQRVAKLEFSRELASSEINDFLKNYQLSSIQSGAAGASVLVSSEQRIDATEPVSYTHLTLPTILLV